MQDGTGNLAMIALEQEAITVRRALHAAPELSGKENNTASYITRLMQEAGARDIVTGLGGTGVAAVFGAGPRNLMIRCELDALPICETGDILGYDRELPATAVDDTILIATAGAYGRTMSSQYNLRLPATEFTLR